VLEANPPGEKDWDVTSDGTVASNTRMVSAVLEQGRPDTLDEDAIQIERFLNGDVRAFDGLYAKYYDRVYAIARGVLLDAEEAADTVQEVFTLVHRHLYRFDRRARFSTWLFRIAVNRSIQDSRKRRRRPLTVELMEVAQYEGAQGKTSDPRVHAAMGKLKADDRALLLLYYWEELSLQEIAETLNANVNATKTRLYRAREKFRQKFEEEAE
jgi:RNA polymerase sigma-70 factor (ECF subfamily)